jgi:hypothetical protein
LGSSGNGYAICLACGRAEPELAPENEGPPLPANMSAHRPLRSKSIGFRCDGFDSANRPFTIQRHRALGFEVTTDVFELQLDGLATSQLALPIAAALRDALARKLGVEDTEMGVTTTQTSGDDGIARWSILIYDKATGGAGFSVAASAHIEELLGDAATILDCPNKSACERGCPECIMCREIETHEQMIDRPGALRFVRALAGKLGLKPELAILGPGTRVESTPLSDALLREMNARPRAEMAPRTGIWPAGRPWLPHNGFPREAGPSGSFWTAKCSRLLIKPPGWSFTGLRSRPDVELRPDPPLQSQRDSGRLDGSATARKGSPGW